MNILIDTRFKHAISAFDIFVPIFFAGVILSSMLIYLILFIKIRKRTYLCILIFFLFFLLYNFFHLMAIIYGAGKDEISMALEINRISIASLMLMFIFLSFYNFIDSIAEKKTRQYFYRTHGLLFILTSLIFTSLVIICFVRPDLFVDINEYSISMNNFVYEYSISYEHSHFLYNIFICFMMLFIGTDTFLIMLKIATDKKQNKFNFMFLFSMMLSLIFMYESISDNNVLFRKYSFNRLSLSIFLLALPYTLVLFDSFLKEAVQIIKKQDITNDNVLVNFETIKNIGKKTWRIKKFGKDVEDKSNIITEVLRENMDAIDITSNKLKNLDIKNGSVIDSASKKLEDSSRNLENIFDSFNNVRAEIDERCKFLFNLIEDSERLANSNTNIENIIKVLSNASRNLEIETDLIFKKIYQSISNLSDLDNITNVINETILSIKDITDKTNLLSINASIHASKAGVLGKSFSVVAKEIGAIAIENSKLAGQIEIMLKNVSDSMTSINDSNQSIKMEAKLLEEHVMIIKESISKLIMNLDEYVIVSIGSKKLLKDVIVKGLSIDNIRKQQDSLIISLQKNVNSLISLESDISSSVDNQKNNINDILGNVDLITDMKKEMNEYSSIMKDCVIKMLGKCTNIDNNFKQYKG